MLTVAALYCFAPFEDPAAIRARLEPICADHGLTGSLLIAREGINGTVAGPRAGIDALRAAITALPGCDAPEWKESSAETPPFGRMKLRLKREIVTMGVPDADPTRHRAQQAGPADWNAVIADPETVLIDTRNDYEVAIGTFRGAVDPELASFRDFPAWWAANRERFAGKRVAMFCTGGIRCEKAGALLAAEGTPVVALKGGILDYLAQVPEDRSAWEGGCFVFDERVSLGHGLALGGHENCRGCRKPLAPVDRARPEFERGVQCHRCAAEVTPEMRARRRERQRQLELAQQRGAAHLGPQAQG